MYNSWMVMVSLVLRRGGARKEGARRSPHTNCQSQPNHHFNLQDRNDCRDRWGRRRGWRIDNLIVED